MAIRLFGINNKEDLPTRRVVFNVTAAHPSDMPPSSYEVYAYTKANLGISKESYNVTSMKKTNQQLKLLPNVVNYKDVVLILGQDAYECIQPLECRAGQPNQPIAVRTALGWVLSGPVSNQALKECSTFNAVTTEDQHLANHVPAKLVTHTIIGRPIRLEDFGSYNISRCKPLRRGNVVVF